MTEKKAAAAPAGALGALGAEVEESLHPMLEWIVSHIKFVVGVVAGLIIAVGAVAVFDAVQASNMASSRAELAEILTMADAGQRASSLQAFAKDAPESLSTAVQLELASALSDAGQHDQAATVWAGLAGGELATVARLGEAAELSRAGKHEEALAKLQDMRPRVPKAFNIVYFERLAYEAESQGDLQTAVSAWEALLAEHQGASDAFISAKIKQLRNRLDG